MWAPPTACAGPFTMWAPSALAMHAPCAGSNADSVHGGRSLAQQGGWRLVPVKYAPAPPPAPPPVPPSATTRPRPLQTSMGLGAPPPRRSPAPPPLDANQVRGVATPAALLPSGVPAEVLPLRNTNLWAELYGRSETADALELSFLVGARGWDGGSRVQYWYNVILDVNVSILMYEYSRKLGALWGAQVEVPGALSLLGTSSRPPFVLW
jgi:hypothetical protein